METKKLTAKDLMIGDWVKYKDGTVVQIARVGDVSPMDAPIYCHTQLEGYFPCQFEDIEPIPLTAEILEKNGFSELMEHDEWSRIFRVYHDDLFIEVGIYEPMFINIGYVDNEGEEQPLSDIVKVHGENFYVHELKHALRLCGINDKEIVP